jgi:hypothetical protein
MSLEHIEHVVVVMMENDGNKNTDWPDISASDGPGTTDESLQTPLNDVQKSLIATAARMSRPGVPLPSAAQADAAHAKSLRTYAEAIRFLHPDAP